MVDLNLDHVSMRIPCHLGRNYLVDVFKYHDETDHLLQDLKVQVPLIYQNINRLVNIVSRLPLDSVPKGYLGYLYS